MTGEDRQAVTIITGASEGIGLELARCFAAAGKPVMLIARSGEKLRAVASEIATRHGVTAIPLVLDLTDDSATDVIDAALNAHNAFAEVLVNNAGTGLSGDFTTHDAGEIERLLQLNVMALTRLMRHFLPGMIQRKSGGVLNVASLGGIAPGPYQAAYYASKAYVISLSEAVAAEVQASGVCVSVLVPGPVRSEFHQRMGSENDLYYRWLPVISAAHAARSGYRGFLWRRRVIIPGIMNNIMALALRITPHAVAVPIVGLLLRPRGR